MKSEFLTAYNAALSAQSTFTPAVPEELVHAAHELVFGSKIAARDRARMIEMAIGTSDFPSGLTEAVQRELQVRYRNAPQVMQRVMKQRLNIPDYRDVSHVKISGADGRMKKVLQLEEYTQVQFSEDPEKRYAVGKYGCLAQVSEEAIYNDSIGAFNELPDMLLTGLLRTLEGFRTSLFFDADGPNDSYFTKQGSVSSLPLTADNLKTAIGEFLSYTDDTGPIVATPRFLVVPPALQIQAMTILNSINLAYPVDGGGSSGVPVAMGTRNVLSDLNIELLVCPWISVLVTNSTRGKTSWALFSDPRDIPAGEIGFLRGYEFPQITIPREGEVGRIQSDCYTFKAKHVFGGCTLDPMAGWASKGQ